MRLIAREDLAVSVSRAQGLGFLGAGTDLSTFSSTFNAAAAALQQKPINITPRGVLPIGVGFICWGADLDTAVSVIRSARAKPAAAWLFAPREKNDLAVWSRGIREASGGKTKIWVQVGTVSDALEAARLCQPDVLVIQGSDAGGHGLAHSSSIITLLPECADALAEQGYGRIPLIAAGGIMDGRGAAAAVMLGASGICLGTRFLCSPEAAISNGYRNAVARASDGGVTTARTTVYDKLRQTFGWPNHYNARGILNYSFWDHVRGMSIDDNRELYDEALRMGDEGWGERARLTTYAGTGVGLTQKVMPAADIVRELQSNTKARLAQGPRRLV